MQNQYAKVMSELNDDELLKVITTERSTYQPLAVQAAENEAALRNLYVGELPVEDVDNNEKERDIDKLLVGVEFRFLHYLIDSIMIIVLGSILIAFIFSFVKPTIEEALLNFLIYFVYFLVYFLYYIVLENKYQKTFAKFITKSKVVRFDDNKPTLNDIVVRTFCRFIPFEAFTFIFVKNGLHDYLSKTKVVKDIKSKHIDAE